MGVYFSHWIVLMLIFLTLLIVSARIRNKVGYNLIFMNQVITILASMTIVCYMMYTVSPDVIERFHSRYLYITNIFVIVGIIRYLQVVTGTGSWADSSPRQPVPMTTADVLLKDHFIQLCIIGLGITFCLLHCLAVSSD